MDASTPLALGFEQLECIEDTNEANDDEPYCVMFVVDNSNPSAPLRPGLAFRTKVFDGDESVEEGDLRKQWVPIWGVSGTPGNPAAIKKSNDIIALVALVENDSSNASAVTSTVQATLTASLTAAAAAKLNRAATVSKLISDMNGAIALGAASGGIDQDEHLDTTKELSLSSNDLQKARTGHSVRKAITFKDSGEDSEYKASFLLRPSRNWKGWVDLGGILTAPPAAASWAPFRLDILGRGQDNGQWHKRWNDSAWSDWKKSITGVFKDAPAAVSREANRIDVFVLGMDNHVGHMEWNGSKWQGWEDLGGNVTSAPTAASWSSNRLDIFARGQDGGLRHKSRSGTKWSTWEKPITGKFQGAPAAVSWGPDRIDVFVRGMDNHLGHMWWNGSWGGWQDLGGTLTSAPAVASWGPNRLDVFVRGQDDGLWHKSWNGTKWSDWDQPITGKFQGAPAAVSWGPDRIDVFVRGMDNHVGHAWWG
jgi:peptide methionine sulfoxide reductase MsrB